MVRTILTISIAVLAVNCIGLTGAGKATDERIRNVETRALVHKNKLEQHGEVLQSKCASMSESAVDQLKEINYIILDHIVNSEKFKLYLKDIFDTLGKYAEGQIESRVKKLEETYKQWEEKNFPDKSNQERARNILKNIKSQNKAKDVEKIVKKRFIPEKDS